MANIGEKLQGVISSKPIKNKEKLEKQQKYYRRLSKSGVAKKQTYNLKPLSAI
jgi:predicted ATP-grasp superfamily ATP-dependent carboligase